jgi:primosomal protein N' (replication factor Y)
VIIQTLLPEHSTIQQAATQNFDAFYQTEIEARKLFSFPPFSHFIKLTFKGPDAATTQEAGERFRAHLHQALQQQVIIHPLIPSGHAKIRDLFRFQFLIQSPGVYAINQAIQQTRLQLALPPPLSLHIDVDPLSTFF